MCFISHVSISQWNTKIINNKFDNPFKKAYTNPNNLGYLGMEVGDTIFIDSTTSVILPFLFLHGSYFCDENTIIDLVFELSPTINKKYELEATKSSDGRFYWFNNNIWTIDFINDFKQAKSCLIRVNQQVCSNDYYQFNMSGSTAAYNFIIKK